jgi:Cell division protein CrgA
VVLSNVISSPEDKGEVAVSDGAGKRQAENYHPPDMPKSRSKRVRRQPPPKPKPKRSPPAVAVLFFLLLGAGVVVIVGNYVGVFPGETSNPRLWYGLGLITASFVVATQWH